MNIHREEEEDLALPRPVGRATQLAIIGLLIVGALGFWFLGRMGAVEAGSDTSELTEQNVAQ